MNNVRDAYLSQPVIIGDKYTLIEDTLKEVAEAAELENYKIISPQYSDGIIQFNVKGDMKEEFSQKLPAEFAKALGAKDEFMAVSYGGYNVGKDTIQGPDGQETEKGVVTFSMSVQLSPEQNAYHPEAEESTEEEAE
jgi:hypothetical protein